MVFRFSNFWVFVYFGLLSVAALIFVFFFPPPVPFP